MAKEPNEVTPEEVAEIKETVIPETDQQLEKQEETEPESEKTPEDVKPPETDAELKGECIYCGRPCESTEFYVGEKAFCCAEHAKLYAEVMKGR